MDYAERGTVEKTLDRLLEEGSGLGTELEDQLGDLANGMELTTTGRAYSTGFLAGILATVHTFSDEDSEFTDQDVEEIHRIVQGREPELSSVLAGEAE